MTNTENSTDKRRRLARTTREALQLKREHKYLETSEEVLLRVRVSTRRDPSGQWMIEVGGLGADEAWRDLSQSAHWHTLLHEQWGNRDARGLYTAVREVAEELNRRGYVATA